MKRKLLIIGASSTDIDELRKLAKKSEFNTEQFEFISNYKKITNINVDQFETNDPGLIRKLFLNN